MRNLSEHWESAMDTETYVSRMTLNRELFARRIAETKISVAELAAFADRPLKFLAITEDFCGDSAQFLPPIARLAEQLDNVEMRFLLRDEHRELASTYRRRDDYQAIPVIIVLDVDGNELGYLIERPARIYDDMAAETRRFASENPHFEGINRTYDRMADATKQAVRDNIDAFRGLNQAAWTRWLFEDLAALLVGAGQRQLSAADD